MDESSYMQRALELAERGRGRVEANPVVGCVIVKGGRVVGEGWHKKFGGPHAEVEALRDAGKLSSGATVYVTLEPCCHHGKTPPCTDALIAAGVKRVVAACVDPYPKVAGRGLAALRRAGIEVDKGLLGDEAAEINAPFFKRVRKGLPYVIGKWAMTVDGFSAAAGGDSRWISGEQSRRIVHELRGRMDAVVVGIGTALADDPLLTAREVAVKRIARRVVIDPRMRLSMDSQLVKTAEEFPLTVAVSPESMKRNAAKRHELAARDVEVVSLPWLGGDGRKLRRRGVHELDLKVLLYHLAMNHAATNVLVEGGAATLASLHRQGLVDEWRVFIGAKVLGGGGVPAVGSVAVAPGLPVVTRMADAAPLRLADVRAVGPDVMLRYRTLED